MLQRPVTFPLAYLITFRTYGSWLRGDARGSVDRHRNLFGSPRIAHSPQLLDAQTRLLSRPPVALDRAQRLVVETAIRQVCIFREWRLHAVNARTSHVHAVVAARTEPSEVLLALKANATRHLRESGRWSDEKSPWSARGSKRYLWTVRRVERGVAYVVNGQDVPWEE